jgi:hypothetical protein
MEYCSLFAAFVRPGLPKTCTFVIGVTYLQQCGNRDAGCEAVPETDGGVAPSPPRSHISVMPNLDLTDEEHAALLRLVKRTLDSDRFPLSPRLYPLRAILAKLAPEPVRHVPPPPKVYAPPRVGRYRRRG